MLNYYLITQYEKVKSRMFSKTAQTSAGLKKKMHLESLTKIDENRILWLGKW